MVRQLEADCYKGAAEDSSCVITVGQIFDIFIHRAGVELNFYVNTGKAARIATWNLGINPAFPSKPSKLHVGVYSCNFTENTVWFRKTD
jgi:hypothetical protein